MFWASLILSVPFGRCWVRCFRRELLSLGPWFNVCVGRFPRVASPPGTASHIPPFGESDLFTFFLTRVRFVIELVSMLVNS